MTRNQKTYGRDEEESRGDRHFARACEPISSLRLHWKFKVNPSKKTKKLGSFLSPHGAVQVKGKTHLANSCEKRYRRCQKEMEKAFCLSFIHHQLQVPVRSRDLRESGMSHELLSASWNSLFKCDRCTVHVCSCY